ncbi:sugar phosphate nucleotidyltransferase [Prochlorococcus sp. MIT 1223]|uniref:sugar phosphate nucleotidyltransferase n=1 Tax=Prochlorococcus sp. MIT 1223 TaxID=3096217 RepID=UPI002A749D68|nr:sugar phosphate nucleotidyltransferase [Prochlorococcus sp. MIT 1223]
MILCGGLGKRLREVVYDVPKPMAKVGGKPFLSYLISSWIDKGVGTFVLSTGYLSKRIKDYFGDNYQGAVIKYVEEDEPLGTGGAIKKSLESFKFKSENIIILNGDTWNNIDLQKLYSDFCKSNKSITVSIKEIVINNRYGSIRLDNNRNIIEFDEEEGGRIINTGCYLISKSKILENLILFNGKFSFEKDFLPILAEKKMLSASWQDHDFIDIGIPSDYYRFIKDLDRFIK